MGASGWGGGAARCPKGTDGSKQYVVEFTTASAAGVPVSHLA